MRIRFTQLTLSSTGGLFRELTCYGQFGYFVPVSSKSELGENVWRSDRRPDERGLRIVGTPVGSDEYVAAFLESRLQTQRELIDTLPYIGDPQSTFLILRLCAVPRANHLLRTVPPTEALAYCRAHDE